jgi:hypothetical protein
MKIPTRVSECDQSWVNDDVIKYDKAGLLFIESLTHLPLTGLNHLKIVSAVMPPNNQQYANKLILTVSECDLPWFQISRVGVMMFNATFNNISVIISWRSVLLVEETGVPGENHRIISKLYLPWCHQTINNMQISWYWQKMVLFCINLANYLYYCVGIELYFNLLLGNN